MMTKTILKVASASIAALSLSGCLGNGDGGVGGGGGSDVAAGIAQVEAMGPTQNMPTTLDASYSGGLQVDVYDGDRAEATPDATLTADLALDITWDDSVGPDATITGGASNFQGVAYEDGEETAITLGGELSVVDDTGIIGRTEVPSVPLPTGGNSPEGLFIGSLVVGMDGTLTNGDDTADVSLGLNGAFFGDGGAGATGAVVGSITAPGDILPSGSMGGQFYLLQD